VVVLHIQRTLASSHSAVCIQGETVTLADRYGLVAGGAAAAAVLLKKKIRYKQQYGIGEFAITVGAQMMVFVCQVSFTRTSISLLIINLNHLHLQDPLVLKTLYHACNQAMVMISVRVTTWNADYWWTIMRTDAEALEEIARLTKDGRLKVPVGHTLPLEDAAEAHRVREGKKAHGKVVLEVKAKS
jgi:hypothetical protein